MTRVDSVLSLFDKKDWNVNDLRKFLETDSTTINDSSSFRDSPLVRVLSSEKCTLDVVRLLLDHGASVNCSVTNRHSPLIVAVRSLRCNSIISELLERGADVRILDKYGQSCICNALQVGSPGSTFKLLLDAGCSPNACQHHVSVLHCASFRPGLKTEVLEMFLEAGADIHRFGRWGRTGPSPLCFALRSGIDARGLRRLLRLGAELDVCTRHRSTLLCATESGWGARLRTGVVQTLLKAGATTGQVNENGWTPLHLALRYCKYEVGAIKAMLDLPGVNVNGPGVGFKGDSLLHLTVDNSHCRLAVVRLLLSHGAKVDKRNSYEDTPLHLAIMNEECHLGVVGLLLEKGSPVNKKNKYGKSPLQIAIEKEHDSNVLHLLLAAGAQVGINKDRMGASLLKRVLDMYETKQSRERLECLQTIVKYSFLEDSDIALEYLSLRWDKANPMRRFAEECAAEMKKMEFKDVGHGHTLKEFLTGPQFHKNTESNKCNFYRLLMIVHDNSFPTFFNVISAKVGMRRLKAMLQELRVFALKECSGLACVEQRTFLTYECVWEISQFLSTADILRLVLVFQDCSGHRAAIEDLLGGNGSHIKSEQCPVSADACQLTLKDPDESLFEELGCSPCTKGLSDSTPRRHCKAHRKKTKRKNSSFPAVEGEEPRSSDQRLPKRKRAKERKRMVVVKIHNEVPVNVNEKEDCVQIT